MITKEEFNSLSAHLQSISSIVPYKWGRMQSRDIDRRLPKLFEYETYQELNDAIQYNVNRRILSDNDDENNYYRHRWFVYKCSLVDEFLFYSLPDVVGIDKNPWYDITFLNRFNLDLKGTVMLKQYKDDPEYVFRNPLALIDSFYKEQTQDFRYRRRLQNRLFLVHHSFISPAREPYLRTLFTVKARIFEEYAKMLMNPEHKIYDYMNGRKTDIIFLIENADKTISYGFGSENLKGELIIKKYINE